MNVLILNASPKSKGSVSAFYSSLLRLFLTGGEVNPLRGARDYEKTFALLPQADAVVISVPAYVGAAPAHVTAFLERAELLCQKKQCHFKLYAISDCGFIEGHQNELHLRIYEAWYQRTGVCWGGGLGIGGGVILRWMCNADSVVCHVRYCADDPDGTGSAIDCANDLFLLRQYARDACDEPWRGNMPFRFFPSPGKRGRDAVSNTFSNTSGRKTMGKPICQGLLAGSIQVAVDVSGGITMPHPFLNILQTKALIHKRT